MMVQVVCGNVAEVKTLLKTVSTGDLLAANNDDRTALSLAMASTGTVYMGVAAVLADEKKKRDEAYEEAYDRNVKRIIAEEESSCTGACAPVVQHWRGEVSAGVSSMSYTHPTPVWLIIISTL